MLISTGCAPTFPRGIMDQVDRNVSFADLRKDPDGYKGKWVMLAGIIVDSRSEEDGSTSIEIVQKPADSRGRPLRTDDTGGRFIAVSKQFLDPAIYHRGRLITVVGEVAGKTVRPLGEVAYQYPLLEVKAVHLWEPYYSGPRFQFGIGVFHEF